MILLERIGNISQINGRGLHAFGFQAFQQIKYVGIIAFIFIDRFVFGAVIKFYITNLAIFLSPPCFGRMICARFHFAFA